MVLLTISDVSEHLPEDLGLFLVDRTSTLKGGPDGMSTKYSNIPKGSGVGQGRRGRVVKGWKEI